MSTSYLLTNLIAAFLLPPLNGLLPAFIGWMLLKRRPRLGRSLIALGLLLLAVLSLPITASALMKILERQYEALPQASLANLQADAIVILGSGRYRNAPEFSGGDDVKSLALERLRYGALLARESGKPILVTGGLTEDAKLSEGEVMKSVLARDFGIAAQWVEGGSENTRENALYSARILLPQGIRRIALVTSAFHMPRSVQAFEAAGFECLPAPTVYLHSRAPITVLEFIPDFRAVLNSGWALHELIGQVWYRLRH